MENLHLEINGKIYSIILQIETNTNIDPNDIEFLYENYKNSTSSISIQRVK